jgi:hypothetical protein
MKQGRKLRTVALLAATSALIGMGSAYAASTPVTASIRFLSDISITPVNQPDFGSVVAGVADTYTLSTAGAVTHSGSGIIEGGSPKAGKYTVTASTHQGINIYADTYANGLTDATVPSLATCDYNAGGSNPCDSAAHELAIASPLASATLLVGLSAAATATTNDGDTDNPSFNLNVVYQ